MGISTITGDDVFTLFDRVFTNFATGNVSSITYPNDIADLDTGKNKNSIYTKNEKGNNALVELRLNRGSSDDQFLNGKLLLQQKDFAATLLANGQFVKRLGDGQGNVINDVYQLTGGIFTKNVEVVENVNGDVEQAIAVYTMKFSIAKRTAQ